MLARRIETPNILIPKQQKYILHIILRTKFGSMSQNITMYPPCIL